MKEIEHWILVASNTRLEKRLIDFINNPENQIKTMKNIKNIQAWTDDERVYELFGLIPEIYDKIYGKDYRHGNPRDWDKEKRAGIVERWS